MTNHEKTAWASPNKFCQWFVDSCILVSVINVMFSRLPCNSDGVFLFHCCPLLIVSSLPLLFGVTFILRKSWRSAKLRYSRYNAAAETESTRFHLLREYFRVHVTVPLTELIPYRNPSVALTEFILYRNRSVRLTEFVPYNLHRCR